MKIYDVKVFHKETNQTEYVYIAKLESELEQALYDNEMYEELFNDNGWKDEDIAFYIRYDSPEPVMGQWLYADAVLLTGTKEL